MPHVKRTRGPGKHGHCRGGTRPQEYGIWSAMIQRCLNPNCREYPSYGARGIRVCDRWLEAQGFPNFLADVGPRPAAHLSLHRQDNDGDYAPGNVAWAERRTQAGNRRSNRILTHDGRCLSVTDWARALGMKAGTLVARLRGGWPTPRALAEPVGRRKPYGQWIRRTPNPRKPGPKPRARAGAPHGRRVPATDPTRVQ
jgi:hypothetical protein